ncbi:MAG: hypothetical protein KDA79_21820, partial [Planctomycetaceae bacterium]|nr:hypothetical protein [Planctomycetaceae bacterium]
MTVTGDATESEGSAEAEPGDDWGFSDKKPGMATETKIGFALILLLITALSLVVYRKLGDQNGADGESRYAGPTIEAGAKPDGTETDPKAETTPPAQGEYASAPSQGEPGILADAAGYAPGQQADEWGTAQTATGGGAAQNNFQPADEFATGEVYTGGQPREVVDSQFEPGPAEGDFFAAEGQNTGEFRPRTTQVAAASTAVGGDDPFAAAGGTQPAQQSAQSQDAVFADQFEPQQNVAASQAEPAAGGFGDDEFFPAKPAGNQSPVRQAAGFEQQPAG